MEGLLGDLFDFNNDGTLDVVEQAAELEFLCDMMEDNKNSNEGVKNDEGDDSK